MSRTSVPAPLERTRPSQISLALVLAVGLNVPWGLAIVWTVAAGATLAQTEEPNIQVQLVADGTPVISHYYRDGRATEFTTVEGKPYPATDSTPWLQSAEMQFASGADWSLIKPTAPWIEGFTDGLPSPVDWFFVLFQPPRNDGYFVGYDRISARKVGYLGRAGFQLREPAGNETFLVNRALRPSGNSAGLIAPPGVSNGNTPAQYSYQVFSSETPRGKIPGSVLHLVSDNRTFRIDLRARTVTSVLESSGLNCVAIFSRPREHERLTASKAVLEDALGVRDSDKVVVLDALGHQETVYRLPVELAKRPFQFYQMANRTAAALYNRREKDITTENLIWFTKEGTIERRLDGILTRRDEQISLESIALVAAVAVPTPLTPIGAAIVFPTVTDDGRSTVSYRDAVIDNLSKIVPSIVVAVLWIALALWLYFRRTARYGQRRSLGWLVFIALFTVPGYLGYVLHRRWPPRIPCAACGVPAPRDRGFCCHCDREFPPPPLNGLEIFA